MTLFKVRNQGSKKYTLKLRDVDLLLNLQNNIQKQIDIITSLNTENIDEIKKVLIPSIQQSITNLDSQNKVNNEDIKTKLNRRK